MFDSIKGILIDKMPHRVVVETAGVGYRLTIGLNTYTRLSALEKPAHFYLSQVVREDSHTLYAFLNPEERDLFEILITLSGIGPKTALAILGHMEINAFQRAIHSADVRILSKIPGIGKKTAERLVIEMRDKFKGVKKDKQAPLSSTGGIIGDTVSALLHLGYNPLDAQRAVQAAFEERKEETDLGKMITAALQKI